MAYEFISTAIYGKLHYINEISNETAPDSTWFYA
jgi:hypothetical protein